MITEDQQVISTLFDYWCRIKDTPDRVETLVTSLLVELDLPVEYRQKLRDILPLLEHQRKLQESAESVALKALKPFGLVLDSKTTAIPVLNLAGLPQGIPRNAWVAISSDYKRVVSFGPDLEKVIAEARDNEEPNPIIVRMHEALEDS